MQDSMMIAEVGDIENVSGSRIATPLAPPRPGSTPMITPSALSFLYYRVEFTELDAGVLGSELIISRGGGSVAAVPPGLDVAFQRRPVAHPVRQVAAEGAQLDLGHVQP